MKVHSTNAIRMLFKSTSDNVLSRILYTFFNQGFSIPSHFKPRERKKSKEETDGQEHPKRKPVRVVTRKSGAAPTAAEEPEPSATAQKDTVVHPHATEASALVEAPEKSIVEAPQPVERQLALLEVSIY